jgi:hypothetical protein
MKRLSLFALLMTTPVALAAVPMEIVRAGVFSPQEMRIADRIITVTGTIERVWEDGFRLNSGDRTYTVDSWEVCGDFTGRHLTDGDRVTVTGELEGRRGLDAYEIVKDDGTSEGVAICR